MVKSCLFQNGKVEFTELDKASVPVLDAAYLFGDGIYEVIAVVDGNLFDLEPHLDRLENSLSAVQIEPPLPREEIAENLKKLTEPGKSGYVYLQISRGAHIKRDFLIASETKSSFFAYFQEQKLFPEQAEGEISVLFPDIRWGLRHIKTTQLMSSRLAKKFATENGAMEPIYVDPQGNVTEGGSSNLFIVKGSEIITHPADNNILWGITRKRVIELAGNFNVVERKFTVEEMLDADEVFRTSTTQGVKGVTQIKIAPLNKETFSAVAPETTWQPKETATKTIGTGQIGLVTRTLALKYKELANFQNEKPSAKTA